MLQTMSFLILGIALFALSGFLYAQNREMSYFALLSAMFSAVLFGVLMTTDPTLLIISENIVINTFTLITSYTIALFLAYFGHWIYKSRFEWQEENACLLAAILNYISAFFLFFERIASVTFYKISFSYLILIVTMIANIYLFYRLRNKK